MSIAVSVRELRNQGGQVLERVERGERLSVTRDGDLVAELRPIRRKSLPASELIARAKLLPKIDYDELRHEIDAVLDPTV